MNKRARAEEIINRIQSLQDVCDAEYGELCELTAEAFRELERASAPAVPDVARESEVLRRMTLAMREADREFERVGGSTRHYVRDCLMPVMEEKGLAITSIADTEMNDE